jgi:leucyl-tRNA synthetase
MVCREFYYATDPDNPTHKIYYYPEDTELKDGARVSREDGRELRAGNVVKMSKTRRNTVEPDDIVARYGADTARLFILFAAPPEGQMEWSEAGVEGAHRFLHRLWRLVRDRRERLLGVAPYREGPLSAAASDLRREIHRAIQRVTHDLSDRLQPNTAVAAQMELANALIAFEPADDTDLAVVREGLEALLHLLSPFAPHIADELYAELGGEGFLLARPWPGLDESALHEETIEIPIQVNGKLRGKVRVPTGADEQQVLSAARGLPNVAAHLESKTLRKVVYVPGRILTLVVS